MYKELLFFLSYLHVLDIKNLLLYILFSLALVDAGYCHLVAEIGHNTKLCLSFKMLPADKVVKRLLVF